MIYLGLEYRNPYLDTINLLEDANCVDLVIQTNIHKYDS